uniref:Uncharacterized protein n=1 Tax=Dasyclonium flaccidum TaxID=2007274 RepID=A0A1Z1ML57_9FLOR|nr:hypothetical protein [Dasyclonium flaccidum]ARW66592.1 hypothetical protein [Dasyclonium flaccidum]
MILFNLILHHIMFQNYCNYNNHLIFKLNEKRESYTKIRINQLVNSRRNKLLCIVIPSSTNFSNKLANEFLSNRRNNDFIYRNFWQKFINKYLQETIFISAVNPLSDAYINQLKTSGLSVYQGNDYKNFLLKFSKDLFNGTIDVSLVNNIKGDSTTISEKYSNYIRYNWFKLFSISNFISNIGNINKNILFNRNIKYESLPLFILINNQNQFIMSESSDKLLSYKNNSNFMLNFFKESILKNYSHKKSYTGLLFINPEDSLEYRSYINFEYNKSTRNNSLKSIITSIGFYYHLLNLSYSDTEFRLIPDLVEVGKLLSQYRKYSNLSFDIDQKYGSNYFQGQPIYSIQPVTVKDKNTNCRKKVYYSYHLNKNNNIIEYKAIFLNYQTALSAWKKFVEDNSYYNLPAKPQLYVSNLETFLKKNQNNEINDQIIFIPSFKTYNFINNHFKLRTKNSNSIKKIAINVSLYTKTIFYRLIWSLTSRQPINW